MSAVRDATPDLATKSKALLTTVVAAALSGKSHSLVFGAGGSQVDLEGVMATAESMKSQLPALHKKMAASTTDGMVSVTDTLTMCASKLAVRRSACEQGWRDTHGGHAS